jgi:ADP-dependent NAD(P)H-hydrate dehydratase / NAD(P)H-hydrate epimerase
MEKKNHIKMSSMRRADTHKRDYGHVYTIAGSTGMTGAAFLSAQAALFSGSGLVTLAIPRSLNVIVGSKLTEVITEPMPETEEGTLSLKSYKKIFNSIKNCDVIACGCGLRWTLEIKKLVYKLIESATIPMVLDGDALNVISEEIDVLKKKKAPIVLTPHPGEMSRLTKKSVKEIQNDRIGVAKKLALDHNVIVVLKGHRTVVANEGGEHYVNETGNSGMATAGSGDVLCGMIASFIGQKIDLYGASKLGVYLHGLSGDIAASKKGQVSLVASDILNYIPEAIRRE